MRNLLMFLVLFVKFNAHAQPSTSFVHLSKGVVVVGVIEKFNPSKHRIDTCRQGNLQYICRINGKPFYGMDQGMAHPVSKLVKLTLQLHGKNIPLEITGFYNPVSGTRLYEKQFRWKKLRDGYMLYAFFSDGAGTYTAHWKITGNRSKLLVLSTDDADFAWQVE